MICAVYRGNHGDDSMEDEVRHLISLIKKKRTEILRPEIKPVQDFIEVPALPGRFVEEVKGGGQAPPDVIT